jgi:hypothetical protein
VQQTITTIPFTTEASMFKRAIKCFGLSVGVLAAGSAVGFRPTELIIHEWGTFTTVAGADGRAVDWYALAEASDLPCFVEGLRDKPRTHVQWEPFAIADDGDTVPIRTLPSKLGVQLFLLGAPAFDYNATRANVQSKVRMETPVLYFYSPKSMEATVKVVFPRGVMTEWYPHAWVLQDEVSSATMRDPRKQSAIWWTDFQINPAERLPMAGAGETSHYFAARETDAAPINVNGQAEKFLFYRGLADFDVPLSSRIEGNGHVSVANLDSLALPLVILFENRGGRIGFSLTRDVRTTATFPRPPLGTPFDSLRAELERALVSSGLYEKEAKAMIATWKDSWFEEGLRVFYLFPPETIDKILPLTVNPVPDRVVRTFVGRMEIIPAETIETVKKAVEEGNVAAVMAHARFFAPIADQIIAAAPGERAKYDAMGSRLLGRYVGRATACQQ